MKRFRKISVIILSAAMAFTIAGCGSGETAADSSIASVSDTADRDTDTVTDTDTDSNAGADSEVVIADEDGWFAAWTAAQMVTGKSDPVINPYLVGNTVRQQIRSSIGGDKIRLTLSNEYGILETQLESVHIAYLNKAGQNSVDTSTDTVITFGGSQDVTIPAGETVVSDEIDFSFDAFQDLAVTVKLGETAGVRTTGHTDALSSVWIGEGDHASDETFAASKTTVNWYFISELDVWAEAGTKTLVVIGDSITDCYGAGTNKYERWSDVLSRRLRSDNETASVSVVNEGIGGNAIFGGLGTALNKRFDRDVLNVAGVRYAIVLIGINDIGGAKEDISQKMIEEYKVMIDKCHGQGIKIYAGTIMPVKGHEYYSELHEQIRITVNEWIRSDAAGFDGLIDFAEAMADPNETMQLDPKYSLDRLHCNAAGYQRMGEYAYERLKELWAE